MACLSGNHAQDIAAMDPFVVPSISFDLLYAYIIVRLHHSTTRSQRAGLDQHHNTSDRRMGCAQDHRSIPVE